MVVVVEVVVVVAVAVAMPAAAVTALLVVVEANPAGERGKPCLRGEGRSSAGC